MNFTFWEWITIAGIALFTIAIAWWKFKSEIRFLFTKASATGTIVNWMAAMQEGKRVYYPMIEFSTASGRHIAFRADEMCEGQPMFPVGTQVQVLYLPQDPEVRKVVYPKN